MNAKNWSKKLILISLTAIALIVGSYWFFTQTSNHKDVIKPTPQTSVTIKAQSAQKYPNEIKGKIVTLKILTLESTFNFYKLFSANVRKGLEFPEKITFGYVSQYVGRLFEKMQRNRIIVYNIWDNKLNIMIGSIQIRKKDPTDVGQLGMWLNENYRGGGRIQETLYLISKAYFATNPEEPDYVAHVRPWNSASIAAMEEFGFKKTNDYMEDGKVTRFIFTLTPEDLKEIAQKSLSSFE